jgi:AcrR family transcriptional regulator
VVQKPNVGFSAAGRARLSRRADARRLAILRAAARVFRRTGFSATGMREIASEAEISPGNLYHYFNGKHELVFFCQERALERLLEELARARRRSGSAADRLRGVLDTHVRCLLDDVEGSTAHLELDVLPAGMREAIIHKRDRYERGLCRLVSSGVRDGTFAPCDPRLVTRAMLGAINWTARWFRADGPRSPADVASEVADYLVRGLRREPGP